VKRWIAAGFWLAMACTRAFAADDIKPFVRGSVREIAAVRQGRPYILGFWSLSCTHCREDLSLLGKVRRKFPKLDVVLVSTDTPAEAAEIARVLRQESLQGAESWVFADSFSERLRFEVDRQWHGELPRTYFYDVDHHALAISGTLNSRLLTHWVQQHVAAGNAALVALPPAAYAADHAPRKPGTMNHEGMAGGGMDMGKGEDGSIGVGRDSIQIEAVK